MNSNICFTFGVLERTNDQNKHHMKTYKGQVVTSNEMNKFDLMNILLDYDIHYPMSTPIEVLKDRLEKEGI